MIACPHATSSLAAPDFSQNGPYPTLVLHAATAVKMGAANVVLQLTVTLPDISQRLRDEEKPFPLVLIFSGFQV